MGNVWLKKKLAKLMVGESHAASLTLVNFIFCASKRSRDPVCFLYGDDVSSMTGHKLPR